MAKVLIAGDFFPRKNYPLFSNGKSEQIFAPEIQKLFRNADFSICNLEGALTDSEDKIPKCGPSFKAPPETLSVLCQLGVNCVTLANNHLTDYGTKGYSDTCEALDKSGIKYFGAGKDINSIQTHYSINLNGIRLTFYTVAETVFNIPSHNIAGSNLYDEYRVCDELKTLKTDCDFLFVIYHGGMEYYQYPTPWLKSRFHRMADCGADFITAQHTHCIGAMEKYNGAYLLYGQGNFHLIQSNYPELTTEGLLLEVLFSDGRFDIKPHLIRRDGDRINYDAKQDISDFHKRSQRLAAGDMFEKEFSAYSQDWMIKWLHEFRGARLSDRIMRKLLSKEKYIRYLRKSYSDVAVLRMLEHVRGEEDVEVMQQGLSDFFNFK